MKVYISTIPFAQFNSLPLELLSEKGIEFRINPLGRKITTPELADEIKDADCLIAGTEVIDASVFDRAPNLKLIARVGIGLDGVDLLEARRRNIKVTYTPDAPAPAVAELTIGLMLQLSRRIGLTNADIRKGDWVRRSGYRLSELTIGIFGSGRIASRVLRRLSAFGTPKILINSLERDDSICPQLKLNWVDKQQIFRESDLISIHVPLTRKTENLVSRPNLASMKKTSMLINTSRGGIVNERDLFWALSTGEIDQAAIDVFEEEPYKGELKGLSNCFLSAHMGSMSYDCRASMEIEATMEVVSFLKGGAFKNEVPESEYILRTSE